MLWTLRNVRDRTCLCYIYFQKKSSGESYIFYVFIPLEDFFLIQVFAALHIFEV